MDELKVEIKAEVPKPEASETVENVEDENAKFPPLRSMTRKELKVLRKKGLDPTFADRPTVRLGVEMADFILETCFPEFDFDNLPADECLEFASKIYMISYGRKIDRKN